MNKENHNNVIIGSMEHETATDMVIEYIRYLDNSKKIIRHNGEDRIEALTININNDNTRVEAGTNFLGKYDLEEKSMWYRRGGFIFSTEWKNDLSYQKLKEYLSDEEEQVSYFLHNYSSKLSNYLNEFVYNNKLNNLFLAQKLGLKIPDTLVTTTKKDLLAFYEKHNEKIITKPLHHAHISLIDNDEKVRYESRGTYIPEKNEIDNLSDNFGLSLFQNLIEKEVEIRIFQLEDKLYPMAIFSQNDEKTKVDFRNYNNARPNRSIPFKLPASIEKKVLKLVKTLGFNTCSMDIILDTQGNYIFLEINPIGQFGWVSKNCNYYLEEKIAEQCLK